MVAQMVKNLPAMQETRVRPVSQKDSLEKGMDTYSSIQVWNSTDRGAWQTTFHEITKCWIQLSD